MRVLAAAVLLALLAGCATAPSAQVSAAPETSVVAEARAPRPSQDALLAAYWAERRAPRVLTASDFFTANFNARSPTIGQNFPESYISEDQSRLDTLRLERESAATREAVRAAMRR